MGKACARGRCKSRYEKVSLGLVKGKPTPAGLQIGARLLRKEKSKKVAETTFCLDLSQQVWCSCQHYQGPGGSILNGLLERLVYLESLVNWLGWYIRRLGEYKYESRVVWPTKLDTENW